jgi:hypothetical protein
MSEIFSHRHPDFVITSTKGREISATQEAVGIEFDAPKNLQNRGHANLVFDRQADGSWTLGSEEVSMWTK